MGKSFWAWVGVLIAGGMIAAVFAYLFGDVIKEGMRKDEPWDVELEPDVEAEE